MIIEITLMCVFVISVVSLKLLLLNVSNECF